MVAERTVRGLDRRLGLARFARSALNKVFPDHWSFMIGEIAMYCLVILILTGVYLTFFFVPDSRQVVYDGSYAPLRGVRMSAAYESTLHVSFDVRAGLLMRQIHHWAALLFVGSILVHLLRIFFTGAFRKPRELNWMVGLTLFLLALANGFTGYSLPDDLLSGTGLRIAYSVLLSIPFAGPWLAFLVFGGEFPSDDIIPRLFVIHILIVPALIVGLLTLHLVDARPAEAHPVRRSRPARRQRRRLQALADVHREDARPVLLRLRGVRGARRPGPDQPGLAVRAVRPVGGERGLAARLVHRLARRRAAAHAAVGGADRRLRDPEPVLPRRPAARHHVHRALRLAVDRGARSRRTTPSTTSSTGRATGRVRTAIGVAVLAFYVVLFLAGGNDVIAARFDLSVNAVTYVFRVLVFVLPVVSAVVAYRLCKELAARDRADEEKLALLERTPEGGYVDADEPETVA